MGVELLLKLGANKIYLAGLDTAISEDKQTHHNTIKTSNIISNNDQSNFNYKDKTLKVKGNLQPEVSTTIQYNMIRQRLEQLFSTLSNQKIYNLSNGAYFANTIPITQEQLMKHCHQKQENGFILD